ncbi:2-oxo-4-hydroxy-4-carboxy-5-ureidoimidazoline decarboxylase [Metabacillus herbersteinensis]|uniref:2-oxo-4-hydroxy-4-carboxy-5-ureidoimidazoline decarboxylase n=1 Tax=Metabacillus herbersteinensis TaxID=283816 RepID=A0ABV6GGI0_9BACI
MDMNKFVHNPATSPITSKKELSIEVNRVNYHLHVTPTSRLVDILREDLGLTGTKISCEIGRCGACAIQMNDQLVNSCLVMAYQANNTSICTIEGIADEDLHPIQRAFLEEGGFQCGYCTPGMIMAVKSLLAKNSNPTGEQIGESLSGNLCRCTGYGGIIRAVQSAILTMNKKETKRDVGFSIENVNSMSKDMFVSEVGWVFEHSPWVAEKAWESGPFQTREELLKTMIRIVQNAEGSSQLALFRAHPDLGTKLKMSEVSKKEQGDIGLDSLSQEEFTQFVSLNKSYVEKFGFPFIMAVKGQSKEAILSAMVERLKLSYEEECDTALNEVYKIASFRLNDSIR